MLCATSTAPSPPAPTLHVPIWPQDAAVGAEPRAVLEEPPHAEHLLGSLHNREWRGMLENPGKNSMWAQTNCSPHKGQRCNIFCFLSFLVLCCLTSTEMGSGVSWVLDAEMLGRGTNTVPHDHGDGHHDLSTALLLGAGTEQSHQHKALCWMPLFNRNTTGRCHLKSMGYKEGNTISCVS